MALQWKSMAERSHETERRSMDARSNGKATYGGGTAGQRNALQWKGGASLRLAMQWKCKAWPPNAEVTERKELFEVNEKIAVLTALQKDVKEALDEEKAKVVDELESLYIDHGVTQARMEVMGQKVGTISYTPPKTVPEIDPNEMQAALEWLLENGLAEIKPKLGWKDCFVETDDGYVHAQTGEMVPWLIPQVKRGVTSVRLSAKPSKVMELAAPLLKGGVAGLMGGGEDVQHVPTA